MGGAVKREARRRAVARVGWCRVCPPAGLVSSARWAAPPYLAAIFRPHWLGMAAELAIAGGSLAVSVGDVVVRPLIDRYKRGRAVARDGLAVYVPGSGRLMDFTSDTAKRKAIAERIKGEKWIRSYLEPPVIKLSELISALLAVRLISPIPPNAPPLENAVQVLGTVDVVCKLEGILLAETTGFLNVPSPPAQPDERVPWELLNHAEVPAEPWREDAKLLDIWFALHCEYIFPVAPSRVLAAANTFHRISLATGGSPPLVKSMGAPARRHYEVPLEDLKRIAMETDISLIRGHSAPVVPPPRQGVRLAGMLGGHETAALLGPNCSELLRRGIVDLAHAQRLGLQVCAEDGRYLLRTEVGQERASRDMQSVRDGHYRLNIHGMQTVVFTRCRSPHFGTLILERYLDDLGDKEVFDDPACVLRLCQKIDQSMGLNNRSSTPISLSTAQCRLAEVAETTIANELVAGNFTLTNQDFAAVFWGKLSYESTLLELKWREGFEVAVVDTIGSRLNMHQVRLLQDEPPFLQFINSQGADVDVESVNIHVPAGRGFRLVTTDDAYCYLHHHRVFTGKYMPVGTVGKWHQTLTEVTFVEDTPAGALGLLGARHTADLLGVTAAPGVTPTRQSPQAPRV